MRHLPAIDGLRAVAVIAVVAYHAGLIPAGFVGVDVFFVISGFLITRLLADELTLHRRIDFFHFYARRARRILPAALVVVIATLVMTYALLPSGRREVAESAAASGLFGANFYFESVTGGYWAANAGTLPLLHLWSLSVEEQFYVVWPLVLIVARKHAAKSLAVLMLASLALAEWLMWYDPQAATRIGTKASVATDAARKNVVPIDFCPERTTPALRRTRTHGLSRIVTEDA